MSGIFIVFITWIEVGGKVCELFVGKSFASLWCPFDIGPQLVFDSWFDSVRLVTLRKLNLADVESLDPTGGLLVGVVRIVDHQVDTTNLFRKVLNHFVEQAASDLNLSVLFMIKRASSHELNLIRYLLNRVPLGKLDWRRPKMIHRKNSILFYFDSTKRSSQQPSGQMAGPFSAKLIDAFCVSLGVNPSCGFGLSFICVVFATT